MYATQFFLNLYHDRGLLQVRSFGRLARRDFGIKSRTVVGSAWQGPGAVSSDVRWRHQGVEGASGVVRAWSSASGCPWVSVWARAKPWAARSGCGATARQAAWRCCLVVLDVRRGRRYRFGVVSDLGGAHRSCGAGADKFKKYCLLRCRAFPLKYWTSPAHRAV